MSSLIPRGGSLLDEFFKDVAPGFYVRPLHGDNLPSPSQIKVDVKDVPDVLYAEVLAEVEGHSARVVICTDQSEAMRYQEELQRVAHYDPLTGLANRSHFEALSTNALARSQRDGAPVTLLLCDVDLFKRINDQYGHAVGDEVLVAMAKVLAANLREGDVLARWGGEEFLALMPASPLDAACATAERIRTAIEQTPLDVGQAPIALTMSFGVAQVHSAEDLQAAIARADKALYQSKNAGRNRVSVA